MDILLFFSFLFRWFIPIQGSILLQVCMYNSRIDPDREKDSSPVDLIALQGLSVMSLIPSSEI